MISTLRRKASKNLEDYLSQFVYGGMDGTVTTFAVVAGATGAQLSANVVIILGFANLIADGFSMSVGSYLSSKSELDLLKKRGEELPKKSFPALNGLMTYLSFLLVGLVPLISYTLNYIFKFNLSLHDLFVYASILTGLSFVAIGMLKSNVTHTSRPRAVLETLLLGVIAAVIAYFVGDVLESIITS